MPIVARFGFIWNLSIIVPSVLLLVVISAIYLNSIRNLENRD